MRIRSIKPEFWRSNDISDLNIEDRLLFIGLWSYVDDNGVGRDEEPLIVSDLFAADMFRDPRETVARVSRGLQELSRRELIHRYVVDNRPYLEIVHWKEHQRIDKPAKARYPHNPGDSRESRESVARAPETFAPGTGEQGNRGTGEQRERRASASDIDPFATDPVIPEPEPAPAIPDGFTQFWNAYPRKAGRVAALKAWTLAVQQGTPETTILAGAARYAADPNRVAQYTKNPANWLSAGDWDADPLPARLATNGTAAERRNAEWAAAYAKAKTKPKKYLEFPEIPEGIQ